EVGFRLLELCLEQRGIELRDHLTFANDRVEIGVEFRDRAGDLTADLDRRDGLQSSGCTNGVDDVPSRHGCRVHRGLGAVAAHVVRPCAGTHGRDHEEKSKYALHYRIKSPSRRNSVVARLLPANAPEIAAAAESASAAPGTSRSGVVAAATT